MSEEINQHSTLNKKTKVWPTLLVIGTLLAAGILVFCLWFFNARFFVSTDDAYVEGNIVEILPKVSGTIRAVSVNDTDYVKAGDVLVSLDTTPFILKFQESQSSLANTLREVQKKFDTVSQLLATLEVRLVNLEQAKSHFKHRKALVDIGGVSREDFENSQTNYLAAEAEVVRIQEELSGAEAQVYNTTILTHPLVREAIEKVKLSWIDLKNTEIKAPVDGYIAKKGAQVGETVHSSKPLLAIVPLDELWVTANLKEVQLSKIRLGQEVQIKTDLYKNKAIFDGTVVGISPGTGSVFSILPPQNATGNWIKIVQRVPVRILINPKQLKESPLRAGLSAKVSVNIKNQAGDSVNKVTTPRPFYVTDIYDDQLKGVESIINQIIEENLSPCNGI